MFLIYWNAQPSSPLVFWHSQLPCSDSYYLFFLWIERLQCAVVLLTTRKKLLLGNPVYYIGANAVRRENVSVKSVPNILPIQLIDNSSLLYNTRSISLFVLCIFMGLYICIYYKDAELWHTLHNKLKVFIYITFKILTDIFLAQKILFIWCTFWKLTLKKSFTTCVIKITYIVQWIMLSKVLMTIFSNAIVLLCFILFQYIGSKETNVYTFCVIQQSFLAVKYNIGIETIFEI